MNGSTTASREQTHPRTLRIVRCRETVDVFASFTVRLETSEASIERIVELNDHAVDVTDLLRRIGRRDCEVADVTDPSISQGNLCYEENGRRYLIGGFWTAQVIRYEAPTISFVLPRADGSGDDYHLAPDELDELSIEVIPPTA